MKKLITLLSAVSFLGLSAMATQAAPMEREDGMMKPKPAMMMHKKHIKKHHMKKHMMRGKMTGDAMGSQPMSGGTMRATPMGTQGQMPMGSSAGGTVGNARGVDGTAAKTTTGTK